MAATYDPTDLTPTTGQVNIVRLLLGDTNVSDAELQDEEINYNIGLSPKNLYLAASLCASMLASKYAGYVTTGLDNALSADYSDLYKRYIGLAIRLKADGNKYAGNSLGLYLGGAPTSKTTPSYTFFRGQFGYPYLSNYEDV